ncbi:DUF4393 domain-containing protein [Levilactobacillus brevis]|uniref:DUF4393 domain-containing protein n=1 Tax=Levilactobacillus brevis TaxID=1580 RepID=UPI00399C1C69
MAAFNPIPDETINAALKPTAKALGDASGSLFIAGFHLIFDPLRKYNIRKEQELTDYANKIQNHITNIPEEYRDASKVNLILKAVDDSKFRLDDNEMQEAFARLIANALDGRTNKDFYPSYSNILSNMSAAEALILKMIYSNAASSVPTSTPISSNTEGLETTNLSPRTYLFDNKNDSSNQTNIAIDLLIHSGLVVVREDAWLSSAYFTKKYDAFEKLVKASPLASSIAPQRKIGFKKGFVSLTNFGSSFTKFIV